MGDLVGLLREMRLRGLTVATCGNLSHRTPAGMRITPTRTDPDDLDEGQLVDLTLDGHAARSGVPSLEWPVHAAVYRARPDVLAVAHTHSPAAIARSFDPTPLWVDTEEPHYLGLDPVPVAPWQPPGSEALAATAAQTLGTGRAVLLERHGVLGVGATPREALEVCAVVEHLARIAALVPA